MIDIFVKPMLAVDVTDFTLMRYPVYGSPKIDGVRALMIDKELKPRSLKDFKNKAVAKHFNEHWAWLDGFDGEMVVGELNAPNMCRATSSALSSIEGDLKPTWYIFDLAMIGYSFRDRLKLLRQRFKAMPAGVRRLCRVKMINQRLIEGAEEAELFERQMLELGYEGVVFKSAAADYKFGRGTMKDQSFMRTKRFEDAEAEIIEVIELERNQNAPKRNELGNQVRSHHQANKVAGGTMGSLKCRVMTGPLTGQVFELGTGFDAETRQWFWDRRHEVHKDIVKFRYFAHGVKDKPRWPSFVSLRDPIDMS